ncbi:DUF305 domain-containing protein [Streptosporangium sp. NPDC002524]|uniref:DUF305 domain-containing protein n=1 Tax=Streptosporangium sp. NPDC002524 TaxID=3154537 RepID=UPI00332E274B
MIQRILFGSILVIVAMVGVAVASAIEDRLSQPQGSDAPADPDERSTGGVSDVTEISEFDYLTRMVPHDQEAVTAAKRLRRSGTPRMRRLGATIAATQAADIVRMKGWLARWYPRCATAAGHQPMMRDLSKLSGDALDRAFLKDMISHHKAAVMMSQHLLRNGPVRHEEVAAFARGLRDTQHAEISRLQRLLETGPRDGHTRPITLTGQPVALALALSLALA